VSIWTGTRPKWLYWAKDGYWQFHVPRLRLHRAFAGKSKRRSDNLAGCASRQRSAAHDFALAGFAFAKCAVHAPAESAALTLWWFIALGPPSVVRRVASA